MAGHLYFSVYLVSIINLNLASHNASGLHTKYTIIQDGIFPSERNSSIELNQQKQLTGSVRITSVIAEKLDYPS